MNPRRSPPRGCSGARPATDERGGRCWTTRSVLGRYWTTRSVRGRCWTRAPRCRSRCPLRPSSRPPPPPPGLRPPPCGPARCALRGAWSPPCRAQRTPPPVERDGHRRRPPLRQRQPCMPLHSVTLPRSTLTWLRRCSVPRPASSCLYFGDVAAGHFIHVARELPSGGIELRSSMAEADEEASDAMPEDGPPPPYTSAAR